MKQNKINYISILSGLVLGVVTWIIVPLVSDSFEPFDNDFAFYSGQSILSVVAFIFGFLYGMKPVFIFLLGVYISCNIYPFIFGSSESRAWAGMGLLTNLLFCIYPLVAGSFGKLSNFIRLKITHNKSFKPTPKSGAV